MSEAPKAPRTVRFYRTVKGGSTRAGILGTAVRHPAGWRFIPAVAGRMPSRKCHPTMEACLPRWVGYPDACESEVVA